MSTASYQCYLTYFGLRENPFHVSPDPRFYQSIPAHEAARDELFFGLQTRQGLLVLTGEAGTGKTTVLNAIVESLKQRNISTSYVFHSLLEPVELFEFILRDFGVACTSARKGDLVRALYDWLIVRAAMGDSPVLVIDEAQSLSLETLDELRFPLNLETPRGKLLQIILAGQSELEEKLRCPQLRQLRQRVMFHCKLPVLSEQEAISYIHSRLAVAGPANTEIFPLETLQCVHRYAKGIPRLINLLCEHALLTAYGEQQKIISPDIIRRIAIDFDLASKPISVQGVSSSGTFGRLISFPPTETEDAIAPGPMERVQALIDAALFAAADDVFKSGAASSASAPVPSFTPRLLPKQPSHDTQFSSDPSQKSRYLRRASGSFTDYWRSVGESFVSDCRLFGKSFEATAAPKPPEPREANSSAPRNLIEPIANGLRQPMANGNADTQNRPSRSATPK